MSGTAYHNMIMSRPRSLYKNNPSKMLDEIAQLVEEGEISLAHLSDELTDILELLVYVSKLNQDDYWKIFNMLAKYDMRQEEYVLPLYKLLVSRFVSLELVEAIKDRAYQYVATAGDAKYNPHKRINELYELTVSMLDRKPYIGLRAKRVGLDPSLPADWILELIDE